MMANSQYWGSVQTGSSEPKPEIPIRELIEAERSDSRIFVRGLRRRTLRTTQGAEEVTATAIEDHVDNQDADAALTEAKAQGTMPLSEFKKELGL
jgi:hypothetical protein